jgi:SAM-dependent methyltransferase
MPAVRAVDHLIEHYPHAVRSTGPAGSITLEKHVRIDFVAPAEITYSVDCFRDTRLKIVADVEWPVSPRPARLGWRRPTTDADDSRYVEIVADNSSVLRWSPTGGLPIPDTHREEISLGQLDGQSCELTLRCAGAGVKVGITTFELSFEKEMSQRARAALVGPADPGTRPPFDPDAPASLHAYSPIAMEMTARHRDGLLLDYGAGLPSFHFRNVVTADVMPAPGVDVVLSGDRLPFADETFDGVFSLAVLEHVPDPFKYGRELLRVLREGCELFVEGAFMQGYHAWPHHYFNTTQMGIRQVFAGYAEELACGVLPYQNATLALNEMMQDWLRALPDAVRPEAESMSVAELFAVLRGDPYNNRFSSALSPEADRLISAGVYFHGLKRTPR